MPDEYYGYKVRENLFDGEHNYFWQHPDVPGMAAEDNTIIFNPYSTGVDFDAVGKNEAVRLFLRERNVQPEFDLTEEQIETFKGTPYEDDPMALKHSIIGRIISGDPSAGNVTPQQREWAEIVSQEINRRYVNEQ